MTISLIVTHDEVPNCGLRRICLVNWIKVMITDRLSKYDLLDQNKFITFLQAITLLSFPPSVFLPLLSQVQEHQVSYGFWFDLIPSSPLLFLRLLLFFYFHVVVVFLWGEKQGWHSLCSKFVSFADIRQLKVSNVAYLFICPSRTNTHRTAHILYISTVLSSQLACSRYLSLPPHKSP